MLIQETKDHIIVKIADFGLARNVYQDRVYTRRHGVSDVWTCLSA